MMQNKIYWLRIATSKNGVKHSGVIDAAHRFFIINLFRILRRILYNPPSQLCNDF